MPISTAPIKLKGHASHSLQFLEILAFLRSFILEIEGEQEELSVAQNIMVTFKTAMLTVVEYCWLHFYFDLTL